jgi:GntR family transcriptional regulator
MSRRVEAPAAPPRMGTVGGAGGGAPPLPLLVFHQSVPLHYQIQRLLRARIESGDWAAGERIPTEMALVERFRVSRATLREALRALERDGFIARHRRRGTFVRPAAASRRGTITNLVLGYQTQIRVVGSQTVPAPPHVVRFLGVPRGEPLRRFLRVEIVDGAPLAAVVNYMPLTLGQRIRERDLTRASMLEVLRDRLGIRLGPLHQQIEARMPDEEVAALLETDLTQPVLLIRLLVRDRAGRPVEVADTFYRADRYRFELDLPAVPRSPAARKAGSATRPPPPTAGGHDGKRPAR